MAESEDIIDVRWEFVRRRIKGYYIINLIVILLLLMYSLSYCFAKLIIFFVT